MKIRYFHSAWQDLKNSPGWFGKLCLLALLYFIPIFGQIVTFAYIYGWAREKAWGVQTSMPAKIFANEDGKFWRRGWFALVVSFAFAIIPTIVMGIGNSIETTSYVFTLYGPQVTTNYGMALLSSLLVLVGAVASIFLSMLAWVGIMRMSIYDTLSSGFQLKKIWKMFRYDTGGIMRILGMEILLSLIIGIVLSIIIVIFVLAVVMVGVASLASSGYSLEMLQYLSSTQQVQVLLQLLLSAGLLGFLAIIVCTFLTMLMCVFIMTLLARALGYWTEQFEVPLWGGQDDPLPFELQRDQRLHVYTEPPAAPVAQAAPAQAASVQTAGSGVLRSEASQPSLHTPDPAVQPAAESDVLRSEATQPSLHTPDPAVQPAAESDVLRSEATQPSLHTSDSTAPVQQTVEESGVLRSEAPQPSLHTSDSAAPVQQAELSGGNVADSSAEAPVEEKKGAGTWKDALDEYNRQKGNQE